MTLDFTKLDPREEQFRIPGPHPELQLFLRYLPSARPTAGERRPVLFLHGATFPSALSIAQRFDGISWRDALNEAGFDVWAIDFYGFGLSDRYGEMEQPAERNPRFATLKMRASKSRRPCASSSSIGESDDCHWCLIPGVRCQPGFSPGNPRQWWIGWCCSTRRVEGACGAI
jgi:pimeloyl-ACP methyl ester carboxylesterase